MATVKPPTFNEMIAKLDELRQLVVAESAASDARRQCHRELSAMFGVVDQETPGMSSTEIDEFKSQVSSRIDNLRALGTDPPPAQ